MKNLEVELLEKKSIGKDIIEFVFERPADFSFQSGQHIVLRLPELQFPDKKGPTRIFTIASSESEKELKITTRQTNSGFKKTLSQMRGKKVVIMGPKGKMVLNGSEPVVFIAGGIGITPFISMVKTAVEKNADQKMVLFYSNKTKQNIAYHDFFTQCSETKNVNLVYVPTITGEADSDWTGEYGRINSGFFEKYITKLDDYKFYVCGSPSMVDQMKKELEEYGVDSGCIFSESFFGY